MWGTEQSGGYFADAGVDQVAVGGAVARHPNVPRAVHHSTQKTVAGVAIRSRRGHGARTYGPRFVSTTISK
jgi:hypothetical protein